jgi:hypothetical protein
MSSDFIPALLCRNEEKESLESFRDLPKRALEKGLEKSTVGSEKKNSPLSILK